jgi:TolB-like protein/DNA-binding winged helix-turn-helix (wHTH) protein
MNVSVYKFGEFALDCGRFELTRHGQPIRLERKPMELLILLAEHNGQLVSREEIADRLWERQVFVDIKHGINTAVHKIRQTLRDDPADPHFVRTVTGKGYCLIVPLSAIQVSGGREVTERGAVTISDLPSEGLINKSVEAAERTNSPARPRIWVALTLLAAMLVCAIVLTARNWARQEGNPQSINSLAVIPLENLSRDPGQDYLADGVTDQLITMLARDSTLRIVSRTSVMQYKGVHRPLREIAQPLGADAIVEGSIARSGDEVHINLQLIAAHSDTHLWAESYDRNLRDIPTLPAEAARAIAYRLHRTPAAMPIELHPDYALRWAGLTGSRISCRD